MQLKHPSSDTFSRMVETIVRRNVIYKPHPFGLHWGALITGQWIVRIFKNEYDYKIYASRHTRDGSQLERMDTEAQTKIALGLVEGVRNMRQVNSINTSTKREAPFEYLRETTSLEPDGCYSQHYDTESAHTRWTICLNTNRENEPCRLH